METRTKEDLKNLEFLAINSKENIEKQVDSYRQQHSYAGTIIGATALYIPFFLGSFDATSNFIQVMAVFPTAFFIYSILSMLSIFRTRPLDQAFNVNKYKDLMTKTYKEILLYEIEANSHSYILNTIVTKKGNKRYSTGVSLTIIALIFSIVLMVVNRLTPVKKAGIENKTAVLKQSKIVPNLVHGVLNVQIQCAPWRTDTSQRDGVI